MARDLGSPDPQVHDEAEAVLRFWFEETPERLWYKQDDGLDAACAGRFGALRDAVLANRADGWRDTPETMLAAIILLDQFSRNIFRGDARAFEADPLALELAQEAVAKGWPARFDHRRGQFLLMPFMHAEDEVMQRRSLELFAGTKDAIWAKRHAEQIARFGRFPQRNAALGRTTTPEEADFLSRPDATF
jgi:uncharacterized protein (DUF924 family)